MVDACTATESVKPMELAAPQPQPIPDSSALRTPPVVMEKTEAPSPRPTKQVATQTGPSLRDYRAELREEQRRAERHEQRHQDTMALLKEQASNRMAKLNAHAEQMVDEHKAAMGRLQEQAAGKEAEFKHKLEEYMATVAEKEKEV